MIYLDYAMDHLGAVAQLITAVVLALNYVQSWRNGREIRAQASDIHKIELATNSMKDQLVKVTGEAKYAEGLKHGEEYKKRLPTPESD